MNREICGQCGQSLDPVWLDERIPKLESMLREAIRERDSLRQHLHDEHQRHVGTMDERDTALAELADARALLQKLRGAARLYRGGGVAGQQMGNESYSILVTGHTLGDIDAALASKPNE